MPEKIYQNANFFPNLSVIDDIFHFILECFEINNRVISPFLKFYDSTMVEGTEFFSYFSLLLRRHY